MAKTIIRHHINQVLFRFLLSDNIVELHARKVI